MQTHSGDWSEYRPIDIAEEEILQTALFNCIGASYQPLLVSTQLVAGTNYSFFCNEHKSTPNPPNDAVIIDVFVDLHNQVQLRGIHEVLH